MSAANSKNLRKSFQFFLKNAGYIVGKKAVSAIELARAELYAKEQGWEFSWEWDEFGDNGPVDWGWNQKDCDRFYFEISKRENGSYKVDEREHTQEICVLKDAEGIQLDCLCGIWDATPEYQRVIEAEMAYGIMSEMQKLEKLNFLRLKGME
jgi:hypothetical protein